MKRIVNLVVVRFSMLAALIIVVLIVLWKKDGDESSKQSQNTQISQNKDSIMKAPNNQTPPQPPPKNIRMKGLEIKDYIFPRQTPYGPFSWGVATSSFQNEGGGGKTDWEHWPPYQKREHNYPGFTEEDIKLAAELGITTIRTSIEWTLVEPEEGKFDEQAMKYFIQQLQWMKKYSTSLHRIIGKKTDEKGIYFMAKGDNNGNYVDGCKIRFNDINYIVVGIIY